MKTGIYTLEEQEDVKFELMDRELDDAKAFLQDNYKFLHIHVSRIDKKNCVTTCNVDFSRVNVEIDNRKITKVSFG